MNHLGSKVLGSLVAATLLLQPTFSFSQDSAPGAPPVSPDKSQVTKPEIPETPSNSQVPAETQTPAAAEPSAPTGTAAAPSIQMSGNPVSRPAGAAIAPANQHRIRSLVIKMGLIAGIGAAVGTVAALTLASPSRVPGSPGGR